MTTKTFELTEEQRHMLGSLIAHTVGSDCLDELYTQLDEEFRPGKCFKPGKPWLEIEVVKRVYKDGNISQGVLGKVYKDKNGKYDYALQF